MLARARTVLHLLEGEQLVPALRGGRGRSQRSTRPVASDTSEQLGLFAVAPNPIVTRLAALDANSLTPLQALQLLAELSAEAAKNGERRA